MEAWAHPADDALDFGYSGERGERVLRSGGSVVAPDREYRFRSGPLVRRWRVTEGRTELVRIQPDGNDLRVRPVAVPSTPADAPLLIVLACTIVTLQQMQPSMGDGGVS